MLVLHTPFCIALKIEVVKVDKLPPFISHRYLVSSPLTVLPFNPSIYYG